MDLSRLSFTDTAKRYVTANSGSLVATYRARKFTIITSAGVQTIYIDNTTGNGSAGPPIYHNVSGFLYSYGLRYDVTSAISLSITAGQGLESTVTHGSTNFTNYVRFDATIHLI